jgi:uncharacterized protein (TIGR02588 family)
VSEDHAKPQPPLQGDEVRGQTRDHDRAHEGSGGQRSGPRRLAEWVSLGISMALILGLAGSLLYEALQPHPPYVPAEVKPLIAEIREESDRYILPIQVANHGERTLRDLTVEVEYLSPDGKTETRDITIDYLGERSEQKVYTYFDRHPRDLHVRARPISYRLD